MSLVRTFFLTDILRMGVYGKDALCCESLVFIHIFVVFLHIRARAFSLHIHLFDLMDYIWYRTAFVGLILHEVRKFHQCPFINHLLPIYLNGWVKSFQKPLLISWVNNDTLNGQIQSFRNHREVICKNYIILIQNIMIVSYNNYKFIIRIKLCIHRTTMLRSHLKLNFVQK